MDQNAVAAFFNRLADRWDSWQDCPEDIVSAVLDNAGISAGKDVLDVACGTGVLIPYYLKRGVSSVTGVDISQEMIRVASSKFCRSEAAGTPEVSFICADAALYPFGRSFDCIVIYDAFPHFADPEALIRNLVSVLRPGGILTVALSSSRERIDAHHSKECEMGVIADPLMPAEDLAELFRACGLRVTSLISDDRMYQVAGSACSE